ncbi:MAG: diaminopimelate decarboxylase [Solobacterium sp.]|nr:diaminopimelate decarboxylase [Solobacterium sp.]
MKEPFIDDPSLQVILKDIPTPFYLYDERGIRTAVRRLRSAFAWNPGFREYYAVKAAPTPGILQILKEEGCGCDCATETELLLAERCGFGSEDIVFSSNDTPASAYRKALETGAYINLDDISHIDMLDEIVDEWPKTVLLRYNPGGIFALGESKEGFQVMDTPEESKFGMTEAQIHAAVEALQKRGVECFGLHAFLASNTLSDEYYPVLAEKLFELAVRMHIKHGCPIPCIDLSGGIGIPYRPEQRENNIEAIGEGVRRAYEKILVPAGLTDTAIWTELGRYITGPHGALITRVIHRKETYRTYIGTDSGSQDLLRPAMYGAYHHITVMGKEKDPCDGLYDVTGSLCENNDKLAVQRPLPSPAVGDVLFIHDAGAHGHSMGFQYNGQLRCAEYLYCCDGSVRLLRRRETPDDLFATLVW